MQSHNIDYVVDINLSVGMIEHIIITISPEVP